MPKINEEMPELEDGFVYKNMKIQTAEVNDAELKKINKLTLEPVKAEDVYVFKMNMADNELDDRNHEPFNLNALKDLQKLYIGKTVIKDHYRKADNQVARVYDTELISSPDKVTGAGEVHTDLIGKCYMVKTASNADLITEIKAGIKKEVSTGCRPKKAVCSICGTDNCKEWCAHYPGMSYDTKDGKKDCYFTLDGAKEAYEVSFVAVPAQPRAGACKNYGATMKEAEPEATPEKKPDNSGKEQDLEYRLKALDNYLFAKKEEEKVNE